MKNLKKKRKFLLRISQNSDYLKSACKTQKKKKTTTKAKSSAGFSYEIKLNHEPWIVKIDIGNFKCRKTSSVEKTSARFSGKIFFQLS